MYRLKSPLNLRHLSSHKLLCARPQLIHKTQFSTQMKTKKWGKDQVLAVGTWLVVGTGAFVLIGTTTSVSMALLLANSLQFQGTIKNCNCIFIFSV